MKILLTQVSDRKYERQSIGLAYIASYTRKYYKDQDFLIFNDSVNNVINKIEEFKPDIVGISAMSKDYVYACELATYCQEKKIFVVIGGIHISVLPNTFKECFDVGILGEGEQTFMEIIKKFDSINTIDYDKIDGIIYWKDNKMKFTPARKPIENLDLIPPPAWDLMDTNDKEFRIFTTRGCPYKCVYCASSHFWGKPRLHSPNYVADMIKEIADKYHPTHIHFADDLFLFNKQRVRDIVKLIKEMNLDVSFRVNGRANFIDREMCKLLKELNTTELMLGLESGNNRVLQCLKGKNISIETNNKAMELVNEYKFNFIGSFIIGYPDETKEEMMDTYNFIKKYLNWRASFAIWIMYPLPVSDIWYYAEKKGLVSNDMDWTKLEMKYKDDKEFENAIILSEKLNREEMKEVYFKFKKLKKWCEYKYMFRVFLKKPYRIFNYIAYKLFGKMQSM